MDNVISYRAKITSAQMENVLKTLNTFLDQNKLSKSGFITTTTYVVEMKDNTPVMDIEVLCPVDRETSVPEGFSFKSKFRLHNALKATHKGNPTGLQQSANEFQKFMTENKLTPITTLYNVTVRDAKLQSELDNMEVDMYIGVTENIL
jgi:effector-binding domain-containing protein